MNLILPISVLSRNEVSYIKHAYVKSKIHALSGDNKDRNLKGAKALFLKDLPIKSVF